MTLKWAFEGKIEASWKDEIEKQAGGYEVASSATAVNPWCCHNKRYGGQGSAPLSPPISSCSLLILLFYLHIVELLLIVLSDDRCCHATRTNKLHDLIGAREDFHAQCCFTPPTEPAPSDAYACNIFTKPVLSASQSFAVCVLKAVSCRHRIPKTTVLLACLRVHPQSS